MATAALVQCLVADLYAIAKDRLSSLFGVEKEVDELKSTFLDIQAVLEDAESHRVMDERVQGWLWELKEVAYEVEDILDEWVTDALVLQKDIDETHHPKRMRFSFFSPLQSCKQVKLQYDIGKRIREITKRLGEISIKKNRFNLRVLNTREVRLAPNKEERETGSLIDESVIFGRDDFKQSIIEQLLSEEKSVSIVSIVGMGGLGKTTLAQLIYNDDRVMAHFEKRIWVCVSDPFDVKSIAIKVIKSMGGCGSTANNTDLDTLQCNLREAIDKKRFLLVLDDVWDETGTQWEKLRVPLMGAAPGSKILVTTRSGEVGKAMKTRHSHDLVILSDPDCWKLFKSIALEGAEDKDSQELIATGERILKRCKGVPLAVKSLGSLLRSRREKWYWDHILKSEIWEWDINGILPALFLSYYNLPPYLKRCFSFCSVFPKDHLIEKVELVKLWMAHGLIKSKKAKEDVTEETGGMYFDSLLTRSLFQDAEKDEYGNIVGCKMHDLVHDLATFVSSGEYCSMEAGDSEFSSPKCRHLSLLVNDGTSSIQSPPCSAERMRTLLLFGSTIKEVPERLFNHLKFLRAVGLRRTKIENLPSSLGKLKHLRYLDLSWLKITELPESVSDLCNLQTLKLNYCRRLCRLPSGTRKMVELRHLEIEGTTNLTVLPNGIGKLTSLRALCKFPLGDENGGCKIRELKDLNLLRGKLEIKNLERVMNVTDASEAKLHMKSDLHVLSLSCNDKSDEEWTTLGDDEMKRMNSLLEGLRRPHSNLKELEIKNYAGSKFPSWLEDSRFSGARTQEYGEVMPSLEKLKIMDCKKLKATLKCLPTTLREVTIENCNEVIWAQDNPLLHLLHLTLKNVRGMSSKPLPYLPALMTLEIHGFSCESLPSDGWGLLESLHILKIFHCPELSSLPEGLGQLKALQKMHILNCKRLSSLPELLGQLKALQTLLIVNCERLSSLPEGLGQLEALQTLDISSCKQLSSLPEGLGRLEALQTLDISSCKQLSSLPEGLGQLKTLQTLSITYCKRLSSLPEGLGQLKALHTLSCEGLSFLPKWLGQLEALQTLSIKNCERLSSLPEALVQLKALQTLSIQNCRRLSYLPEWLGQFKALRTLSCKQLSSLPEGLGQLEVLETLHIKNCERMSSLPEGLGQLKALQTLHIKNCKRLSSLPEGLGQLKALQTLHIENCEILASLPEGLGLLKALQTLHIENCEILSSLPEGLGQLKALQTLKIWGCERLSSQFDGFEQLKLLRRLDIWDCPQLRPLPNLQHLTALKRLSIQRCPLLTERLEKEKGEDWCKISHIPCIDIDDGVDHDQEYFSYMTMRMFRKMELDRKMEIRSATSSLGNFL